MKTINYRPKPCSSCGEIFQPAISTSKYCSDYCSFIARVDYGNDKECWEWMSAKTGQGYGNFATFGGQTIGAHRFAWTLQNGPIPDGMHICHKCDNRICVNPSHLFIGTAKDNIHDMISKGRRVKPNPMRGESHPSSKVSERDVRHIRQYGGLISKQKIADIYGVSHSAISHIIANRSWKHILPNDEFKDIVRTV